MIRKNIHSTRMTGMDQVIWNLTNDQDLFCIWGIASLEEPLRDDVIKKALQYLIQMIPILNSRPATNWFSGEWQFIAKENVDDLIVRFKTDTDETAEAQLKKVFVSPINASENSMIRLISIDGPSKHYFVIQVHHLVVDGEGLKRICVRFAENYQELAKDINWKPPGMLDPNRSWRQIAKYFGLKHFGLILKAYINIIHAMTASKIKNRVGYKIAGDADDSKSDDKSHAPSPLYFESIILEKELMLNLKAFTKQKDVTVNDVFMSSLSLATMTWNKERGDEREWLQFGYTANLRRWWGEPSGTFGNFSVILIHEEDIKNLQDPSMALANTKSKVDRVKKTIGLDGFVIMMQLKLLPYFIVRRFFLRLKNTSIDFVNKCHAMTNIGIMFKEAGEFGHTRANGYSILAPTLPGGCIVYTITTYHNVTTIYLGCSENYLKKNTAQNFLLLWRQMLQKVISI